MKKGGMKKLINITKSLIKKGSINVFFLGIIFILWGNSSWGDQKFRIETEEGIGTIEVKNEVSPGEIFLAVWYLTKSFGESHYITNDFMYTGIDGNNTLHLLRMIGSYRQEKRESRMENPIHLQFKLNRTMKTEVTMYVNIPNIEPIVLLVKELPQSRISIEYLNPPVQSQSSRSP
jgi:hypothetical protein